MSAVFAYSHAAAVSAARHVEFAKHKLQMPVLALGGEGVFGDGMITAMLGLVEDVRGGVVKDCGQHVVEEEPESVAEMLLDFLREVDAKIAW
jgi:hypothetical protein